MVTKFSARIGHLDKSETQIYYISQALRNRIWNLFHREEILRKSSERLKSSFKNKGLIEDVLLDKAGLLANTTGSKTNRLKDYFLSCEWFEVLDFVEAHIETLNDEEKESMVNLYNELFEYEGAKFRLINHIITPIYNKSEIDVVEQAASTEFDSVNQHFKKALAYFSDRKHPDYENSIKESISAVEAMCCIINGKNETLNKALDHLQNNGVHIHPAMKNAFVSLYAYTCDEKGIRHAGIEFVNTPSEDAKYMLISCSAFVNYLIEKWTKTNKAEEGEM